MPSLRDYLEFKRGKLAKLAEQLRQSDTPAIPLQATRGWRADRVCVRCRSASSRW